MNEFFRRLQADREIDIQFWKKHPELRTQLVDDAYPDEAHFVYELLQNAEDAGATTVEFELFDSYLALTHDGTRLFSARDVEAITDVSKTGKGDGSETIGRFGIGFKSVFKYTESPQIFSGDFSFEIVDFVCPKELPPRVDQRGRTIFIFPFNNSKKTATEAYTEIRSGLEQLADTTLLFLKNLQCIRWMIGNAKSSVLRYEHSGEHIEVLKETINKGTASSHWLRFMTAVGDVQRFTAPVPGVERQNVAVAFELAPVGELKAFDPMKPIAKQLKIVPAITGKVSVFFPADKETSGLRLHLHAPFIPDLSRTSIKDSQENVPLYEQLARLAAKSLHRIKELGLLTGEFLAVLPHNNDQLPDRYQGIRTAIVLEMREQPLTPTQTSGFAPATRLLQARATMKELLSDEDLAFLLERNDRPTWSIGAREYSEQDYFLSSLEIEVWDDDSLVEFLSDFARKADPTVVKWLESKPDDWHQLLYAILFRRCEEDDDYGRLNEAKIVRLRGGKHTIGRLAYFATDSASTSKVAESGRRTITIVRKVSSAASSIDGNDPFPRVSENVLTLGARKTQQVQARKFLENIGVRVPGEVDELKLILKQRYAKESEPPADEDYLANLKRFVIYAEKNPHDRQWFAGAYIFKLKSDICRWAPAGAVYLDSPFKATGLTSYHAALPANEQKKWSLADWYIDCGLDINKLASFAEWVGCSVSFNEFVTKTDCSRNPMYQFLLGAPGRRATDTFASDDYAICNAAVNLLSSKDEAFSRLTWVTMCRLDLSHLKAHFRWNQANDFRHADSQLVHTLKTTEWVPLKDGRFVTPRHATQNDLLKGFTFDVGYKWLETVEFGLDERERSVDNATMAAKRAELGFESDEELQRAQRLVRALPPDEIERVLAEYESRQFKWEFPDNPLRNKELRNQRVREQAGQTPEKQFEVRPRSVAVGYKTAKTDAELYLRDQYTNSTGVMFCQVCKDKLPFKLPNGAYYFEAVEISETLVKRFRETFLALCPNDAAKFKYANEQKDEMLELLTTASELDVEVVLGGQAATIRFRETHLADIKACLQQAEDESNTLKSREQTAPTEKLLMSDPSVKNAEIRSEIRDRRTIRIFRPRMGSTDA